MGSCRPQLRTRFDGEGDLTTRSLHGPAVDWLLARSDARGATDWYLTDRLGSVRALADAQGAVINRLDYDAYGNPTRQSNPAAGDVFGFTGRERDPVTKLQYNRHRYYDAAIGGWTQEDPIGFAGGDANLYRYVGNTPVNAIDPTGLQYFYGVGPGGMGHYIQPTEPEPVPINPEPVPIISRAPACLKGTWLVRLRVRRGDPGGVGHAWIHFENSYDPSDQHSAEKYKPGHGPALGESPLQWDINKDSAYDTETPYIIIENPVIYQTGGYNLINSNCASYASEVWGKYSGVRLSPGIYPHPSGLADSIEYEYYRDHPLRKIGIYGPIYMGP